MNMNDRNPHSTQANHTYYFIMLHLFFVSAFKADHLQHYRSNLTLNIAFEHNLYAALKHPGMEA